MEDELFTFVSQSKISCINSSIVLSQFLVVSEMLPVANWTLAASEKW